MITLICTKCKATLEMDDAFAGGVCRCQYCGTIQTVPSHLKNASRAAATSNGQKALYSTKAGTGAGLPSSGLDELANVVASSGLSSGLSSRGATRPIHYAQPAPAKPAGSKLPLIIGGVAGAVVVLVVVGVVAWILTSGSSSAPTQARPGTGTGPGPVPTASQVGSNRPAGPHFLGVELNASKVVYLLDRGDSNRDVLDPVKAALYESLASLGADRDFQVLFWTRDEDDGNKPDPNEFAFPKRGTAKANEERIREAENLFQDMTTSGRTDVGPVLREAMKRNPEVVVVATAKGINLDENDVEEVERAVGNKNVVIHTFDLTQTGEGRSILEPIAKKTGGQYRQVAPSELRSW